VINFQLVLEHSFGLAPCVVGLAAEYASLEEDSILVNCWVSIINSEFD
jgi:hypothetical protein